MDEEKEVCKELLEEGLQAAFEDLKSLDNGSKERDQKIREIAELTKAYNEYAKNESAYWTADEDRKMELKKEEMKLEADKESAAAKLELEKILNEKEIELKDTQIKMERNRFKLEIGKVILDVGVGAALWALTLGFNAQYGSVSTKDALRMIPKLGIKWK